MVNNVLEIHNLTKKFGERIAVNNVSFAIQEGEIFGFLGANGAGKSTTIKILSGILVPDNGECRINGLIPWKDREKYTKDIGVVFGQRSQLWWDIPAEDTFDLLKEIYKIDEKEYQKNKEELINLLNIKDIINIPVRNLSLGQRMRCEIAASLIHNPSILFLDEPTIGLDAVSKEIVRDFIKKLNKEKKTTIILTTHDMSDIEALAKRIILIGKGSILYDGSLNNLKSKYASNKKVIVKTNDKIKSLHKKGIISYSKLDKLSYIFTLDTNLISISDFISYLTSKISINDIEVNNENIDNIIIKLYKDFEI